jgi:hypothetical protein
MMRIVLSNNRYWPVVIILLLYFLIGCERHIVYTINNENRYTANICVYANKYFVDLYDNQGNLKISREVGIDIYESGISSFMWHPHGKNLFALKVVGEYKRIYIYIFDVDEEKITKYRQDTIQKLPKWVRFPTNSDSNLKHNKSNKKYRVRNHSVPN